jgi:hypothetical protein
LATSRRELASLEQLTKAATLDPAALEGDLRARLEEWRELLRRHIPQARQVLKKLLVGPLRFMPQRNGEERYYEFTAQIALGRVFNGIAGAIWLASPTGSVLSYQPIFQGEWIDDRRHAIDDRRRAA